MRSVKCIGNQHNQFCRYALHENLKTVSPLYRGSFDAKEFVKGLSELYKPEHAYGKCNPIDFAEMSGLVANLLAFNNKRYYLYKAISNPNKIGYLSHRQYMALLCKMRKWDNAGIVSRRKMELRNEFLSQYGMMVSPVKLFKEAFKENPLTKSLARVFHLEQDGKTTAHENALIEICEQIMKSNTGMQIRQAEHVQECYDLDLYDPDYRGSGSRFATSSCMYRRPVGGFYDAWGAKGMLVYKNGEPVGRFLMWKTTDGHDYVDRLYTKGTFANDALAQIDKEFPKAIKYPFRYSESPTRYFIEIANPDMFVKTLTIPYIDSFPYLVRKGNKLMLSNLSNTDVHNGIQYMTCLQSTRDNRSIAYCPHCKKIWFNDNGGNGKSAHSVYCEHYQPRNKSLQAMLKIFREGLKKMEERKDDEKITFESLFEV